MIIGAHSILYSKQPDADRAFLRDVLLLPHVDVGDGWLIFGLPPAEVAVHPSSENDVHELYLLCADVEAFVASMWERGVSCGPVQSLAWGRLTELTLPGGGRLGVYQPAHERPEPVVVGKNGKDKKQKSKAGSQGKDKGGKAKRADQGRAAAGDQPARNADEGQAAAVEQGRKAARQADKQARKAAEKLARKAARKAEKAARKAAELEKEQRKADKRTRKEALEAEEKLARKAEKQARKAAEAEKQARKAARKQARKAEKVAVQS